MSMTILVMVIAYYVIILGIGLYVTKWVRSDRDYILAGREVSTPVVALGASAILASGAVVASAVTSAYNFGFWYGFMVAFGWGFFFIVFALVFAPLIRRSGVASVGEWIAVQYDKKTQKLAAILMIFFVGILFNVLQLTAGGQLFSGITGYSYPIVVIVTGLLATAYVWFGGLWGTAVTDIYQFIGAALVFVGLPIFLWLYIPDVGGLGWLTENVPDGWWGMGTGDFELIDFGSAALLGSFLWAVFLIFGNQFYWIRMASARSEKVAIRGGVLAGIIAPLLLGAPIAIIGGYALALFPGQSAAGDIWGSLLTLVPAWVVGLVMVALLAAVQSTVNANILAASANVVRDVVEPTGKSTPKISLQAGRLTVLACGLISTAIAAIWPADPATILAFAGALSAALAFPILLNGMILRSRKLTGTSGFIIMAGTFVVVAGWQLVTSVNIHVIWVAVGAGVFWSLVCIVAERTLGVSRVQNKTSAVATLDGATALKSRILEAVRFGRNRMDLLVDSFEDVHGEQGVDLARLYDAVDALVHEGKLQRLSERWVGYVQFDVTELGLAGLRALDERESQLAKHRVTDVDLKVLEAVGETSSRLAQIADRVEGSYSSDQVLASLAQLRINEYVVDKGLLKSRYKRTPAGVDTVTALSTGA